MFFTHRNASRGQLSGCWYIWRSRSASVSSFFIFPLQEKAGAHGTGLFVILRSSYRRFPVGGGAIASHCVHVATSTSSRVAALINAAALKPIVCRSLKVVPIYKPPLAGIG